MNFVRLRLSILLALVLFVVGTTLGEDKPHSNPKRDHAFELYRQGNMVAVMPLFEELSANNPKDVAVMEAWGASVLGYAQTLSDTELRKKARIRARSILLRAQTLGDNSDFVQTLLRGLPDDGSFSAFSDNKEVENAMQQAETDFVHGDLDKARQSYIRAHLLDPKQYAAALFIGDTYFKQHQMMFAGEWFAQAIQIDPNRETAYRYWGDALLGEGKLEEARSKYIEAIVADPYNQNSWNGLKNWLGRTKLTANWLKLNDGVEVQLKDGGNTNVTLDSSLPEDVSPGWMMYGMNRSLWMSQKFKKEFPKETTYRHCLPEETESLSMLLEALNNGNETKGTKKLNKSNPHPGTLSDFEILRSIEKAGFLEPFVLLNRADNGIAQDYPAYRNANREKVRRYLDEFVVPKTPPQPEAAKN